MRPLFNLANDTHEGIRFVMDAGAYRYIRFNHRVMRAVWIAAYAAWEGYSAIQSQTASGNDIANANLDRFRELLEAFETTISSDEPQLEPLPGQVPEPGSYPTGVAPEKLAPAELATIAAGWVLLHEARHLKHQQEGTAAPQDAPPCEKHREELSCDEFATRFLLECVASYATEHSIDRQQVERKRRAGIYFALFAMTLATKDKWEASDTHPAMQDRLDATVDHFRSTELDEIDGMAYGAFCALKMLWPATPMLRFVNGQAPA